ncbi:TolC family protein [Lutibacter sp. HS1-25]|uniref:TolC family protein n=1 Tax=Lutibacter sp. HS1-25 TaxID=2485000 RepID=UPI0013E96BB1|nr:TolC family protein [Lutibacter sp. HS1-25]
MTRRFLITISFCLFFIFNAAYTFAQTSNNDLDLQKVLYAALDYNKSLKNNLLDIEKSEEVKKSIKHTYIPTLELGGSYAYTSGKLNLETDVFPVTIPSFTLPPLIPGIPAIELPPTGIDIPALNQNIDFKGNVWMGGLTAKWTLFTGLKAPYLSKAMEHKIEAQEQMYKLEEANLITEVASYYDKLALLEQTKRLLEIETKRLEKETIVAKKALEQGLITQHEFQKVEIAQLKLASKQLEYDGGKELLLLKLHQLTGIDVSRLSTIKVELTPRLVNDLGNSYLNRPELAALDEATKATEYQYKSEINGYLPKIQAFASHQYAGIHNGNLGDLGVNELSLYPLNSLGLGMKWELFDGLETKGKRDQIKIDLEKTRNKKEEVNDLLELNYKNCLIQFNNLTAQTKLKDKQMQTANKSLDISYKEYQNGLIHLSDFLESQAEYTSTTLDYYDTVWAQRNSALELLKATGSLQVQKL